MAALPAPATMLRAFRRKDPTYDGVFYVAVRTTGIFCRNTCRAKPPRRENIEFFATPTDALQGGYRPCKRCRPVSGGAAPPALVPRLVDAVERARGRPLRDADLRGLGIDPATARRQFRRWCGLSFHAWQRGRRMGLALQTIRRTGNLTDAQLDGGFESASGFRDALRRLLGDSPRGAAALTPLAAGWLETPLGAMLAVAGDDGVHLLEFVDRCALERELRALRRAGFAVTPGSHPVLAQLSRELREYFLGGRTAFAVPVVIRGTPFEEALWRGLLEIPFGETRSYADLARAVGRPGAARAVGRGNGANRIAIVIPCHRVIGADGTLTGYGGGLPRKRWLLAHEQRVRAAR